MQTVLCARFDAEIRLAASIVARYRDNLDSGPSLDDCASLASLEEGDGSFAWWAYDGDDADTPTHINFARDVAGYQSDASSRRGADDPPHAWHICYPRA
jgi:hypothetical protein